MTILPEDWSKPSSYENNDLQNISIVIGLNYGDEGKGNQVIRFATKNLNHLRKAVVRFAGGHQVGHTIKISPKHSVMGAAHIHTYSNFTSTAHLGEDSELVIFNIWSKFCTVSPYHLINEHAVLGGKLSGDIYTNYLGRFFIDLNCPLTTIFDIIANQRRDNFEEVSSVGVGYGNTMARQESPYKLYVKDIYSPLFLDKLKSIEEDYYSWLSIEPELKKTLTEAFFQGISLIKEQIRTYSNFADLIKMLVIGTIIFEGNQGFYLDQEYGVYPHVSYDTSIKNIGELLEFKYRQYRKLSNINLMGCTRTYNTRHGSGPFQVDEELQNKVRKVSKSTEINKYGIYQGEFKIGYLSSDSINYALFTILQDISDMIIPSSWSIMDMNNITTSLVISCADITDNKIYIDFAEVNIEDIKGYILEDVSLFIVSSSNDYEKDPYVIVN